MTNKTIRADLVADAADYILERYTDKPMEEPSESEFQKLLLEFEIKEKNILTDYEVYDVKCKIRWVWNGINPDLEPPEELRVKMDKSSTGWKK